MSSTRKESSNTPRVAIIMGSDSDWVTMEKARNALQHFEIPSLVEVISAHRTPHRLETFAKEAEAKGIKVMIAGAGGAAHLPGMMASFTILPVIGVPVPLGALQGQDALYSIVQMPKGVPVATVAIGNAWNAGILAAQILGCDDEQIRARLVSYKKELTEHVAQMNEKLSAAL